MTFTKKLSVFWILLTGVIVLILPTLNVVMAPRSPRDFTSAYLFNTDALEGALALACYRAGISWDPERVVVGKEGWLFLGDHYESIVRHTRGIETETTIPRRTERTVRILSWNEAWMKDQDIPTLFVIAPNKYSVYPEFVPPWMKLPDSNFTDRFVAEANAVGLTTLDLRPVLMAGKETSMPVYYELDSHWNQLGSYLGYRATVDQLNAVYDLHLQPLSDVEMIPRPIRGGGTSSLIKLNPFLGVGSDREVAIRFADDDQEISIQALDSASWETVSPVMTVPNRWVSVSQQPHHIVNKEALNDLRVLWLRDSFGNNNSRFFHATFREIWTFHLAQLHGPDLEAFIKKVQPDLVLFQCVERSLHGDIFRTPFPESIQEAR